MKSRRLSILLAIGLLSAAAVHSQVATGTPPFSSLSGGPDVINLDDLNVHYDIPIFSKPGRGLAAFYQMSYDNAIWYPVGNSGAQSWQPVPGFGWHGGNQGAYGLLSWGESDQPCDDTTFDMLRTYSGFVYYDSSGTAHTFQANTWSNDCTGTAGNFQNFLSDDGAYSLSVDMLNYAYTVVSSSGAVIHPPTDTLDNSGDMTDANGNQTKIAPASGSSNALSFIDSLGMTALTMTPASNPPDTFIYTDTTGTQRTISLKYSQFNVQTSFGCPGIAEYGPVVNWLPTEFDYPDGTSYVFTYEPTPGHPPGDGYITGRVASVKLPTGGTISYNYFNGNNGIICSDGSTAAMNRYTPDSGASPWVYGRGGTSSGWQTNIEDPLGNYTSVFFNSGYEVERDLYQGAISSANLLETIITCYNGTALSSCASSVVNRPIDSRAVYRQWPAGNLTSEVKTSYVRGDLPSEVDEYDFGSGSPGALLRKTITTYASLGNDIVNRVSSVQVQDAGGNPKSITNYYYDQTGLGNPTGAPQHVAVSGSRGNLTEISRWVNTSGLYLNTFLTYDDTGNVTSSTDPGGHTTYFQYANSSAYVSQVTLPQTGTVVHTLSATYDSNTGLITQSKGQNQQPTNYHYDAMLRPTETDFPDGGKTTVQYIYAGTNLSQIWTWQYLDAANHTDSRQHVDAMGRIDRTANQSYESGWDMQDTCFNADGQTGFISSPYRDGNGWGDPKVCSGAGDASAYDGLGRPVTTTHADGNTATASYSGNCVTSKDETNRPRQMCTDALGRLVSVTEPNPSTGNLTSGSYLTTYGYDLLNNLQTGTQNGDGSGTRVRTFNYDSLSRLLNAMNPETGMICYGTLTGSTCNANGYDADGNLLYKTDARGAQISYAYDALNRLTRKSYNDGTPGVTLNYDQSSGWGGTQILNYTIGRISEVATDLQNNLWTDHLYSYDRMGRVVYQPECLPSECGHAGHTLNLSYDLAGNLTSLKYPDGRVVKNTFNPAARFSTSTFDNWNGQAVGYQYLSVPSHTPTGAWATANYGNGMTESGQYNSRLQPSVLAVSSAARTWMSRTYNWYTASGQDNGNLMVVHDNLNSYRDQYFGYDWLNRIGNAQSNAPAGSADAWSETYTIDPWGNTRQSGSLSFTPNAFDANNRISQAFYSYDAAGNLYADSFHTYAFDGEERVRSVDSTGATYTFDGVGDRVRKDVSGGEPTEYVYLAGFPIAEHNPATGDWSDYIYANGRRIARADNFRNMLTISGTNCSNCGSQWAQFTFPAGQSYIGYVIQSGDKLTLRQYQQPGSQGGMVLLFQDGTNTIWQLKDQNGVLLNDETDQNVWDVRVADLSAYAGKGLSGIMVNMEYFTSAGNWAISYDDIVLTSADGTVRPIYTGAQPVSMSLNATSGVSSAVAFANHWSGVWDWMNVTYYHNDHLGTSRLLTDGAGDPVWQGTFLPFGQEWNSQTTTNHYKFTGDEHDDESNLEHTQFRQLSTTEGRWLSPDPAGLAAADLTHPQSLNLYAYVLNNPMILVDSLGLQDGTPCTGSGCHREPTEYDMLAPFGHCGIDGIDANCGVAQQLMGVGAAAQCPGNDCFGLKLERTGFYRDTPTPYLSLNCNGSGLNDYECWWSRRSWQFVEDPENDYFVGDAIAKYVFGQSYRMAAGPVYVTAAATDAMIGGIWTAEAIAEAPAISQFFFGRAGTGVNQINSGIFNSNQYLRIGSGWYGPQDTGYNVFRISTSGNHFLDIPWQGGMPPAWPPSIVP